MKSRLSPTTIIMNLKTLKILFLILCAFVIVTPGSSTVTLQERFRWKSLDYVFPTTEEKYQAQLRRKFIPENNLPVGIEIWNEKLFVTVPRWKEGIPSTLNYIPLNHVYSESPQLIPYPDWESNELGNCRNGLTTVYRIKVDRCDRLWVLDTGTFGIGNTTTNPCPYTLNIFDLHTNQLIRKYQLRKEDTNQNTFIANIAVDIGKSCEDTFAYMSDELGYGLVVYSWEQHKSWRFSHGYFMPDPLAGDFNIGGLNFQWSEEGIFGMALSPLRRDGYRVLYFCPLASNWEFAVSTKILRSMENVEESYHDFVVLNSRGRHGHVTSKVMDENGLEFFNLIDLNAVGCWNSHLPYTPEYLGIVDKDDEALSFPADVKVDRNQNVWVISDRMPNFLITSLNYSDVNFRIFSAPVHELIRGTVCEI